MAKIPINSNNKLEFESFIGPWVLPNEQIPVHIIWDNDFDYNYVEIRKPKDLRFIEAINIKHYEEKEDNIIIEKEAIKILNQETSKPNFFGLIFTYPEHNFPNLKLFKDIEIYFKKSSEILKKIELTAKIFRPLLKNVREIAEINLVNNKDNYDINLNLECEGFGFVLINFGLEMNNIKIPIHHDIFEKVCDNIIEKYNKVFNLLEETNRNNEKSAKPIDIDKKSFFNFCELLKEYVNKSDFEKTKILDTFKQRNIQDVLVVDFVSEMIKELRIRYKSENSLINNSIAKVSTEQVKELIHSGKIYIRYKDLVGNEYDPIEIDLSIKDKREQDFRANLLFKINVEKISDNTYKNIEKVKRE